MARKLRDILPPQPADAKAQDKNSLRWRAVVPITGNPLLMLEAVRFAVMSGAVVLLTLCLGLYLLGGGLHPDDIGIALRLAGLSALAVPAGFFALGLLFFGNRYFAVFSLDERGVFYEGSRGRDESGRQVFFGTRPMPVLGEIRAKRTSSHFLPWERVSRFEDFPNLRVVVLRRGPWHLLKLYTPDSATHEALTSLLKRRLG